MIRDSGCEQSPGSSSISSSARHENEGTQPGTALKSTRIVSWMEGGVASPSTFPPQHPQFSSLSSSSDSGHSSPSPSHCQSISRTIPIPSQTPIPHTLRYSAEDLAMKTALAFSWDVQFAGSFPISSTDPEKVGQRLERFRPQTIPKSVQLSVSLLGVRVSQQENVLMAHSLRRVCSVIARPSKRQVAYIAMEPTGQVYRRQCHVFLTHQAFQVEEIESVLGNAFQAALLRASQRRSEKDRHSATIQPIKVAKPSEPQQQIHSKQQRLTIVTSTPTLEMPLETRQRVSSTAFLSRLLGKGKEAVIEDAKAKRKRRPVSAVFSSAIHRFASTANVKDSKRLSTAELTRPSLTPLRVQNKNFEAIKSPPLAEPEDTTSTGTQTTARTSSTLPKEPVIIYDEKLGEYVYPMDEMLEKQLEQVAYFCRLPPKDVLMLNLLAHPEGAFVVRYSESRRSLALSVRVPYSHNVNGVSNYLIVRNEKGFKIKCGIAEKYFPSLQTLVTHHSVIQEQLPCRLLFVQWKQSDWKAQKKERDTKEMKELKVIDEDGEEKQNRNSKIYLIECDENRNTCYFDEPPFKANYLQMNRDHELLWSTTMTTPKSRRSRQFTDSKRRSRFVELEQL
ncbi:unnamed protein product, partial [Mesorhabditis belari]|uniref:PID domain-containing protein n=1 Tax=Mesorhabditis belari TaxID=2138241 RepID=A0AAF3F524_9BILA